MFAQVIVHYKEFLWKNDNFLTHLAFLLGVVVYSFFGGSLEKFSI